MGIYYYIDIFLKWDKEQKEPGTADYDGGHKTQWETCGPG
jgi:hypothetical protein